MNITEVRNVIKLAIAEAMEKGGLPKSGGKLVHLKKELQSLKSMREALGQYQIAEGGETSGFVAEYAHMQKFVNELEKIKSAHAKLAEMLDNQISEVEGKVSSETEKIKEMMGLIEKAKKPAVGKKDDKKADKIEASQFNSQTLEELIPTSKKTPEYFAQKINRCMAMEYNTPDKKAHIYIITSREEVELKWLNKALEFFDKTKIKYI